MDTLEDIKKAYLSKGISPEDIGKLEVRSKDNLAEFLCMLQRRCFGESLDYVLGEVEFYGRRFKIDRRVYTTNPETERLTRLFMDEVPEGSEVLEIGTGCGNIATTIALERPDLKVYAADVVREALDVARENATSHGAKVDFFLSNYVYNIPSEVPYIISDLPYGDREHMLDTSPVEEVSQAPPQAFFHPNGPLEAYRELIESVQNRGWRPLLYFETGPCSEGMVTEIIPEEVDWRYILFDENYSITKINFEE